MLTKKWKEGIKMDKLENVLGMQVNSIEVDISTKKI